MSHLVVQNRLCNPLPRRGLQCVREHSSFAPMGPRESRCRPCGVCVAFLSPLRGLLVYHSSPTACAVGFILSPLRGLEPMARPTFLSDIELRHRLLRDSRTFPAHPALPCRAFTFRRCAARSYKVLIHRLRRNPVPTPTPRGLLISTLTLRSER